MIEIFRPRWEREAAWEARARTRLILVSKGDGFRSGFLFLLPILFGSSTEEEDEGDDEDEE